MPSLSFVPQHIVCESGISMNHVTGGVKVELLGGWCLDGGCEGVLGLSGGYRAPFYLPPPTPYVPLCLALSQHTCLTLSSLNTLYVYLL